MAYEKITRGTSGNRANKGATGALANTGGSGHMPTSGANRGPKFAGISGSFKTTPRPAIRRNNPDNVFVKKNA